MGIIRAGEIVQAGKTKEVIAQPQSEYVARFLGYENVFKAHLIKSSPVSSLVSVGNVKLEVQGKVNSAECIVAIRPEDVGIDSSPTKSSSMNVLEGIMVDCVDQGHFVAVTFDAGIPLEVVVTRSFFLSRGLEVGQRVKLVLDQDVIRVIEQKV
jgi:ABC-type Fe3+/spermidine/putrescine transport system ATPase subunit